jgi:hypothetical protein
VSEDLDLRISPEPSDEDREAILATVHELLRREEELARPSVWRLAGWLQQRVGIDDIRRWVPTHRRWPLSARWPRGGRVFPGLNGRADGK